MTNIVTAEMLQAMAAKAPQPKHAAVITRTAAGPTSRIDWERVLADSGIDVHKRKQEPDGRVILEVDCMTSNEHDDGACFTVFPSGAIHYGCRHASCRSKSWEDVRAQLKLPNSAQKVSAQTLKGISNGINGNLFRTPGEMAASGSEETEWLAPGIVALGNVTDLVGKIKLGKTSFVLALVKAILTGGDFIGQPCRKSAVVYLSEQGDSSFMQALKRARLVEHDNLHIFSWHLGRTLTWPHAVAVAAEHATKVGAGLLIVDTLGRWASIAGDSENDAGAAASAMEPLKLASASLNIAVMTVRHGRKSGGDIGDDGRGSSAFGGDADILLSIRRPEGNHSDRPGVRELQGIGRFDETPERVLIELKGEEYVLLGDEAAVAYQEAVNAVMDVLPTTEADALPEAEITKVAGAKRTTVQRVLRAHVEAGRVGRTGQGKRGDPVRYWAPETVSAQTSLSMAGQKPFPQSTPTPIRPEMISPPLDPTGTDKWSMDL